MKNKGKKMKILFYITSLILFTTVANASDIYICSICPPGTYARSGDTKCTSCPVGTYSNKEGSSSCTPCPAGTYSNKEGSSSCTPCPAGTYSNKKRSSSCTPCPSGHIASSSGSTSCTQCIGVADRTTWTTCPWCCGSTQSVKTGDLYYLVPNSTKTACVQGSLASHLSCPEPTNCNCAPSGGSTTYINGGTGVVTAGPGGHSCSGNCAGYTP